jgi:uncharacterized protein involved in exopolysaccharide biosynthesis
LLLLFFCFVLLLITQARSAAQARKRKQPKHKDEAEKTKETTPDNPVDEIEALRKEPAKKAKIVAEVERTVEPTTSAATAPSVEIEACKS